MKEYKSNGYKTREYSGERFMLIVSNEDNHMESSFLSDKWEVLYMKAKEEALKGNQCELYELKYEFIG
jgi:hypothetical protein